MSQSLRQICRSLCLRIPHKLRRKNYKVPVRSEAAVEIVVQAELLGTKVGAGRGGGHALREVREGGQTGQTMTACIDQMPL